MKKLIAGAHAFICDECVAMCSKELWRWVTPGAGADTEASRRKAGRVEKPVGPGMTPHHGTLPDNSLARRVTPALVRLAAR